jgi:glutathione-regulated potassium-efflux system protein KefB
VLFSRAGFGSILGLLATGVVLGPWGDELGIAPTQLRQITEFGVVFLLFIIGLEMDPRRLWALRRAVFGLGVAQVVLTGVMLALLALLLGQRWQAALILGFGLALSSTAFVLQLLEERGEGGHTHGRIAFAVLLLQDLAVVPLLTLVPLLAGGAIVEDAEPFWRRALLTVTMLGVVVLFGELLLPRVLDYVARLRNMQAFTSLAVLAVLVAAWALEMAGLSPALGAFLMGMLLSRSRFHHQIQTEVEPFRGWLLSLFFVSVGMSIDLGLLWASLGAIVTALVVLIAAKALLLWLLVRLFGAGGGDAVRVALLLAQGGEFAFVLFGAAELAGILSRTTFLEAVLLISLSMAATPMLARLGELLARRIEPGHGHATGLAAAAAKVDRHVIVAGFGRVGRTVGLMLRRAEVPMVALDLDSRTVLEGRRRGFDVHYGNAGDHRVLEMAGAGRAVLVVVTLDSPAAAERVVAAVRNFYPSLRTLVRARDLAAADRLSELGATEVMPELTEMSLGLGERVLAAAAVPDDVIERIAGELRADHFARLRRQPGTR